MQCAGITRSMASQPTSVNRLVLTYSGKSLAAMNSSDQKQGHLFHIDNKSSGLHFLVDTGAEVSVIPPSQADCRCPQKTSPYKQSITLSIPLTVVDHLLLN